MRIKISQKGSKKLKEFNKREWLLADEEQFGQVLEWKETQFVLEAFEKEKIVGTLSFKIKVGVAYIDSLIVAHQMRGEGIGKALLHKAEYISRKENAHKISLATGKGWNAENFY